MTHQQQNLHLKNIMGYVFHTNISQQRFDIFPVAQIPNNIHEIQYSIFIWQQPVDISAAKNFLFLNTPLVTNEWCDDKDFPILPVVALIISNLFDQVKVKVKQNKTKPCLNILKKFPKMNSLLWSRSVDEEGRLYTEHYPKHRHHHQLCKHIDFKKILFPKHKNFKKILFQKHIDFKKILDIDF